MLVRSPLHRPNCGALALALALTLALVLAEQPRRREGGAVHAARLRVAREEAEDEVRVGEGVEMVQRPSVAPLSYALDDRRAARARAVRLVAREAPQAVELGRVGPVGGQVAAGGARKLPRDGGHLVIEEAVVRSGGAVGRTAEAIGRVGGHVDVVEAVEVEQRDGVPRRPVVAPDARAGDGRGASHQIGEVERRLVRHQPARGDAGQVDGLQVDAERRAQPPEEGFDQGAVVHARRKVAAPGRVAARAAVVALVPMVFAGRARHVRVPDLSVTACSAPVVPAVAIVPRCEAGRTSRTGLRVEPIAIDVPRTRVARVRVARPVWLCHHDIELPLVDEEGEPVFPPLSPGCVVEAVEVEHEHLRRPPRVRRRQRQPVVARRPPARLRGVADPEVQPVGAGDAGGNRRRPAAARRGEDRLAEIEGQAHRPLDARRY
eukprot:CAMPEP_0185291328 /NCGR_PEP_ID=MMETSP1363-20130426/5252_1 /TAXON_ID=38817 /ORGANISM="Gephyrocapsa oceanica, Strain RCC1303" /LENGTH=433 /DNA_ID=CAMNT_0027887437 /DNA_START=88 /DNA_END=1386 /DNA_ORIENTATION=+